MSEPYILKAIQREIETARYRQRTIKEILLDPLEMEDLHSEMRLYMYPKPGQPTVVYGVKVRVE